MGMFGREERDPKNVVERRRQRVLRSMNEPMMPRLCRTWFICMLGVAAIILVTELVTYARYADLMTPGLLMANLTTSLFFVWLFFSCVLLPCCVYQINKLRKSPAPAPEAQKPAEPGDVEPPPLPGEQAYRTYCIVSLCGLVVTGLLYLFFG